MTRKRANAGPWQRKAMKWVYGGKASVWEGRESRQSKSRHSSEDVKAYPYMRYTCLDARCLPKTLPVGAGLDAGRLMQGGCPSARSKIYQKAGMVNTAMRDYAAQRTHTICGWRSGGFQERHSHPDKLSTQPKTTDLEMRICGPSSHFTLLFSQTRFAEDALCRMPQTRLEMNLKADYLDVFTE